MHVTITWTNSNSNTIWAKLAAKLGRDPTHAEATAEVKRILAEGTRELTEAGKLSHQRRR